MNLIRESREYIWAFPIIGGVLILISFFTPAHYFNEFGLDANYWMWGLYHLSAPGYGSETIFMFTEEFGPSQYTMPIFFSGLIPAVIILIGSIMLIASSNAVRTGRRDIKNVENGWIGMGFMMIIASIIYIIAIDITWMNLTEYVYEQEYGPMPPGSPGFWDIFSPGFAIIAPFIGGGLALLGAIIGKSIGREEGIGKPKAVPQVEKPVPVAETPPPTPTPAPEEAKVVRFCPECGTKIEQADATFCTVCGHKF